MKSVVSFFHDRPALSSFALAAFYFMTTSLYPLFNKPGEITYCLEMGIDSYISFSPPWILAYISWYLFIPVVGLTLMFRDKKQYAITFLSLIAGLYISYLTYTLFQTTVPRPEVIGNDIYSKLVRLIHSIDQPYNAFPSIHVLATYALMLGATKTKKVHATFKIGVWIAGLAIIISTVYTKQHVVADIFGGIALAHSLHWLVTSFFLHHQPKGQTESVPS